MAENTNRTFICSVLFLDIVGYSRWKVADQISLKERFNGVLSGAIAGVARDDRIILDTGDGAAVSFLGDPEDALFAGMALRDTVANHEVTGGPRLQTRIGINLGPVRVVKDINGQPNIIGDGINVAQRVMSFAEPGQILVSRSYYEIMARLSDDYANLFHDKGAMTDKHVREHEVWAIDSAPSTLRRTVHAPRPRPRLRLPKLRLPRFPKLSFHAPVGAGLNSKLFVAAPLAFTLIVGTGVIARSYRTTDTKVKLAAIPAPQPPQVEAASKAELLPVSPVAEGAPKAQEPVASPKSVEAVTPQQRAKAPSKQVHAKPPAGRPASKAVEPAPKAEQAAPDPKESETVALAAPAPRDASIKILAFPWAEVYVDGQRQGVSPPLRAIPIKPGRHRVELRNSSFPAHLETVEVKSGAEVSVRHRFRR